MPAVGAVIRRLVATALLAAATSAAAQTPVETRSGWTIVPEDRLGIFVRALIDDSGRADSIVARIARLPIGDSITSELRRGDSPFLLTAIRHDIALLLRLDGTRGDLARVNDLLSTRWRTFLAAVPGQVRISVDPVGPRGVEPERLRLTLDIVDRSGCIILDERRAGDTLTLVIHGLPLWPYDCSEGGAYGRYVSATDADAAMRYIVVEHRDQRSETTVFVTRSAVRVSSDSPLVLADARLKWRPQPNTFDLECSAPLRWVGICARFRQMILRAPGIEAFELGPEGVIPYGDGSYFRFRDLASLAPVHGCLLALRRRGGPLGVGYRLELWNGAGELREGPGTHDDCMPWLPRPGEMANLEVLPAHAALYDAEWNRPRGYAADRAPPGRIEAWEGRRLVVHPRNVALPPDTPATGGHRRYAIADMWHDQRRRPQMTEVFDVHGVFVPPDRYDAAFARHDFHARLEEWWYRGGTTIGDTARYADRAWIWVEEDLNWYYLPGATTGAGVRAYLDLVRHHGADVTWTVADEDARGPQPVLFGPARTRISGFPMMRWRN